jgi:hypothetical protein
MKILFSSYRLDQFSDPEGFHANIGMVLEQYPIDTIKFVTDPRTGIQRRCKWPPTVAEVVDACEEHLRSIANAHRFATWGKGNERLLEAPRQDGPTLDGLEGEVWTQLGHRPRREARRLQGRTGPLAGAHRRAVSWRPGCMKRLTAPWMTRACSDRKTG